jgi:hypothetical protein
MCPPQQRPRCAKTNLTFLKTLKKNLRFSEVVSDAISDAISDAVTLASRAACASQHHRSRFQQTLLAHILPFFPLQGLSYDFTIQLSQSLFVQLCICTKMDVTIITHAH